MKGQMDIFDFIECPIESWHEKLTSRTQFEQLFEKVRNPVLLCVNCLCQYCVNNEEEVCNKVRPDEVIEPCFNCDECQIYSGDCKLNNQRKEECVNFVMSDYGAERNRKRIKLVKSYGDCGGKGKYET